MPDLTGLSLARGCWHYGLSSYLAMQRSRVIGIRVALGAEFGDIAELVY
jgi:hypothetical protein